MKQMPAFRNLNTGSVFYRHNEPHKQPLSAGRSAYPVTTLVLRDSKKRTAAYLNVRLD